MIASGFTTMKGPLSSLLLATGLVLVFAGISHALGYSVPGMIASIAVIAALLYAGGAWFGTPPGIPAPAGAATVLVFDRELRIVAGPSTGAPLTRQFPRALRPELETRCRAALRGESSQFTCEVDGRRLVFDVGPVASASGDVLYGVLMTGAGPAIPIMSTATPTYS
jgi:hypothetical protein